MKNRAIFIAATGQNVGKTTVCLGLFSGLMKRFNSLGFIKPVGQETVNTGDGLIIDKDAVLFKNHFKIASDYTTMSPVLCTSGFTRDFLDKKIDSSKLRSQVKKSFQNIANEHDYVLVEGTGHVGVGTLITLNNAIIAKELGLDVIIIACGGLGSSIDELSLNIEMCKSHGVKVKGIILNKVLDEKREMIMHYYPKALEKWGIPLLGCIPYLPFLSNPSMKDFVQLFETKLLSGKEHYLRHFKDTKLVAGSLKSYLDEIAPNQLVITPSCREDIIYATIERHLHSQLIEEKDFNGGMILTGNTPPSEKLLETLKTTDIPTLYTPYCSFTAMKMITQYIAKIRGEDVEKIEKAIQLVEKHVDFDLICKIT